MAKREAIDEIYRQSEAASKTAKSKAVRKVKRQDIKTAKSVKTVKPFKATLYLSLAAQSALEHERHARRIADEREGSDFSSLADAAILKAYGKRGAK